MKYNRTVNLFLKQVIKHCRQAGVAVRFVKARYIVDGGTAVSGYFSDQERVLAVAIKAPLEHWLGVLVHEYCHLIQWETNCKAWRESENTSIADAGSLIQMWMDKSIELTENQKRMYFNKTIELELDCEKKAVKLIKKFKLPINLEEYVKKANAYLASYQAKAVMRKWTSPGRQAYKFPDIWQDMPSNFSYPYFKKLSPSQVKNKFGKCFK